MTPILLLAASVLDPAQLLKKGGFVLLLLIVFAESGLLIGFFLPGDSLLFIAGMVAAGTFAEAFPEVGAVSFGVPLWVLLGSLFLAAFLGDQVGYAFGRKTGPALFRKDDSRLFKKAYVDKAQAFFEHHGPRAIILARFVPIVRTFCPIVAGVGRMEYRTFVRYNAIGALVWGVGVTMIGYFLGSVPVVRDNIEIAILVVVAVSLGPVVVEFIRHRRHARAGESSTSS
ncbi:MAG: VTT domain-containing protein [Actinomycetes bacterium]